MGESVFTPNTKPDFAPQLLSLKQALVSSNALLRELQEQINEIKAKLEDQDV